MIRKFHDARVTGRQDVVIWGTGSPRREFLHVDDLADACVFLMERYDSPEHINVGTGEDLSILELAHLVRDVVHPAAHIVLDGTKPDGTPRKLLDVTRLHNLGWRHRIDLREGIAATYEWFVRNEAHQFTASI
jgi:GDP-L-fucose synthase